MNETRKEIISLISDYMDKTLSEGCLYFNIDKDYILSIKLYEENSIYTDFIDIENRNIGHYDLSALLKTIQSFGLMLVGFDGDCINFYSEANQKNYRILNKPLHLYDTNEEKELLDLLLKLKNDFK